MVLFQRLAMSLAAFTPSPLILGHTDNQSSLTDRDIYFEQTRYRHRASKRTRLPYHLCKHHTMQIRNKLMREGSMASHKWHCAEQGLKCKGGFPHSLLLRVCLPTLKTEWQLPLLTIVQRLPTPCFLLFISPIRAFAFASPSAWNLPQLFAWLSPSHSCGFY